MKPMKVAISFPGCHRRGGVERIVTECATYLCTRGHDVHVFASVFDNELKGFVKHPVPVRPKPNWSYGRRYFHAATQQIDLSSFDAFNTHGCVCPFGGLQWVQSLHAAWLEQCERVRPPWSRRWVLQRLNPLHKAILNLERQHFGERRYARLIATTEAVRDDLHRIYGVPHADISIVPNGFSPREFNPAHRVTARERARASLGLRDEFTILMVANELERKGYPTLLKAIRRLDSANIKLLVAGRPKVADVLRGAAAAGVASHVIAVGGGRAVADLHAAADIMVLPTQYEAFCLAILEALGSGLPVITTMVPGARDAIIDGVNGRLVANPFDAEGFAAAIDGYRTGASLASTSLRAPHTVQQYQWPAVLNRYEDLLRQTRRRP